MSYESPAYHVIAVPIEKIKPNTYNPNAVAPVELKLLYDSIIPCRLFAITPKRRTSM